MDNILAFIMGATTEETLVRFFLFLLVLSGIFDWIGELVAMVTLFLLFLSPTFRCAVCHPCSTVYYGVRDLVYYFLHREYNNLKTGEIVCFCGMF